MRKAHIKAECQESIRTHHPINKHRDSKLLTYIRNRGCLEANDRIGPGMPSEKDSQK